MRTLRIAIADRNVEYLERLVSVLSDYSDIQLFTYSDRDSLCQDLELGKYRVLLLDPSMYDPQLPIEKTAATIFLTGDGNIPVGCEGAKTIHKYQRIDGIYQSILNICSRLSLGSGFGGKGTTAAVSAVYSPIGGSGKTTVSLIAATKLASMGYRTLYLNLEAFPSDDCYLPKTDAGGLSTLMERLSQPGDKAMYMKSCLAKKDDNLFYMNHFDTPNDYAAMTPADIEALISLVRASGCFDMVIVDMNSEFDEKIERIFEVSDQIIIVEKSDPIAVGKLNNFYLQSFIMDKHGDKFKRLLNFDNGRTAGINTELSRIGRISMIMNGDCASLIMNKSMCAEAEFVQQLLG